MKILRGTIFGGIAYFLLGWLVYGILLMDFFSSGTNTCANRPEGEMIWWAIIASNLLAALFLTLFLYWRKASGIVDGLTTGAIFGALFTSTIDLSFWSMTTMYSSFVPLLVEIIVSTALFAIIGMIIVLTWGKDKQG
jgi:hypothetical protein